MNVLEWAVLLTILALAPAPLSPATFPIPRDVQEIWPGAKLTDADKQLLQRAVASALQGEDEDARSGRKYSLDSLNTADIALGALGKGVIVLMSGSSLCGTGGCPIYVYVREKAGYRKVLGAKMTGPIGWAFAVVSSRATVPDLVIATNNGGGQMGLILFRYTKRTFTPQDCEILTARSPNSTPTSQWDPSQVNIEPCAKN